MANESSPVGHAIEPKRLGESGGQISPPRFNILNRLKDWLIPQLRDHPERFSISAGAFFGTTGGLVGNNPLMLAGLTLFLGGFVAGRFKNGPRQ